MACEEGVEFQYKEIGGRVYSKLMEKQNKVFMTEWFGELHS